MFCNVKHQVSLTFFQTMVIPEDQDGKSEQCTTLQRDLSSPKKNTRQGGRVDEINARKVVVVDMREFRSELPALIHKRGIDIEPVTITVTECLKKK